MLTEKSFLCLACEWWSRIVIYSSSFLHKVVGWHWDILEAGCNPICFLHILITYPLLFQPLFHRISVSAFNFVERDRHWLLGATIAAKAAILRFLGISSTDTSASIWIRKQFQSSTAERVWLWIGFPGSIFVLSTARAFASLVQSPSTIVSKQWAVVLAASSKPRPGHVWDPRQGKKLIYLSYVPMFCIEIEISVA